MLSQVTPLPPPWGASIPGALGTCLLTLTQESVAGHRGRVPAPSIPEPLDTPAPPHHPAHNPDPSVPSTWLFGLRGLLTSLPAKYSFPLASSLTVGIM